MFVEADEHKFACDIAVLELAPEVVIRQDYDLLRSIFRGLAPEKIDDWAIRGKVRFFPLPHTTPTPNTNI